MARRVAVVGAGYAGMAAAVKLVERGAQATVFESGPLPGGRARRVTTQGHTLDNGQHILIGAYRETLRLLRRVGADPERLLRAYNDALATLKSPLSVSERAIVARNENFMGISFGVCGTTEMVLGVARRFRAPRPSSVGRPSSRLSSPTNDPRDDSVSITAKASEISLDRMTKCGG